MIKKLIAVTAACAAAATMSTAAFAEVGDVTATYDENTKTVTASVEGVTFSDQVTVVITDDGAESITSENIYYIDQDGTVDVLSGMGMMESVIDDALASENGKIFEVRVGCTEGNIYTGKFTIGGGSATPEYPLGDADLDTFVTSGDASAVLNHVAGNSALEGDALLCADADQDTFVTSGDASAILNHVAGNAVLAW
jgi:hypothetical protein